MAIEATDLKLLKSATVNDGLANGGRMSTNEIVSNVPTNLFPNVTQAERTAGITRYRKFFSKLHDDGDEVLYNHKVWVKKQTPAADSLYIKVGTNTDTQAEADDYTDWLGCGRLNASANADATSVEVLFEDDGLGISTGDKAWLSDGTNEEFVEVSGVSFVDATATITLASGLTYSYAAYDPAAQVWFAGYEDLSDTTSSIDSFVLTGASNTYDGSKFHTYNEGTIEDDWELEIEAGDATYKMTGTIAGEIATAQTKAAQKSFSNPSYSGSQGYYFSMDASALTGTWIAGEKLNFSTHHAAKAMWAKEIVTAGTASYSNNNPEIRVSGESA